MSPELQATIAGIRQARAEGIGWDDIADHIAEINGVDPAALAAARAEGISAERIVTAMVTPQDTSASAPMPDRPFVAGVGRGMEDVAAGAVDMLPDVLTPDAAAQWVDRSGRRAATYDEANPDIGFDAGRVAGQVAGLSPLMLAGPAATATTGRRIAGNAAAGAAAGYVPRARDEAERRSNAVLGALFGAAVPEALRAGVGRAVGARNAVAARGAQVEVQTAVDDAVSTLPQMAPDAEASVRSYLSGLATDQIRLQGRMTPEIIARAAKIASVDPDLRPTLGQLTRDPNILSAERNLSKSGTRGGNLIADRYRGQDATLRNAADRMKGETGGRALSPYKYGEEAGGFLRGKWDEMQTEIGKAYDATEAQHGASPVDISGLVRSIADTAFQDGSETASGKMANLALNRLKTYGLLDGSGNLKPGANLSVGQLRDLRQSLSSVDSLQGFNPGQSMRARGILINQIDDAVSGSPVGDVFKPARDMARARFSEFADRTLEKIKKDNLPNENIFDMAVGRDVDTARDFMSALRSGTPDQVARGAQIEADTKRRLIGDVLRGRGTVGEETMSPAALRRSVDPEDGGYSPEVLEEVLTPEGATKLRNVVETVDYLFGDPAHNSINYSKSGTLLSGLADGGQGLAGRLSDAGSLVGVAAKAAGARRQNKLAEALLAGDPSMIPGHSESRIIDALLTKPPKVRADDFVGTLKDQAVSPETYRAALIDALFGGGRTAASASAAGVNR